MTKSRLLIALMCTLLMTACASHDNRPAIPKDLPPPNQLGKTL